MNRLKRNCRFGLLNSAKPAKSARSIKVTSNKKRTSCLMEASLNVSFLRKYEEIFRTVSVYLLIFSSKCVVVAQFNQP